MTGLVFCPISRAQLSGWASGGILPGRHRGYAVTAAMTEAFGLSDPEDAEYTALSIASIAGLLAHGERVVAVLELDHRPGDDEFGAVEIADPGYAAVTALFGEDTEAGQAAEAAVALRGMTLDQAWESATAQALLAERDLLWYGPAEWRSFDRA